MSTPRRHDLVGQKFNRYLVLEFAGRNKHQQATWLCRCDCGTEKTIVAGDLKSGRAKSCGCLQREWAVVAMPNLRHGHRRTNSPTSPTYQTWRGMLGRCHQESHIGYPRYGGKGVIVCERWHDFENFLADMGERPKGTTLGRYGDVGNYEPRNVKWMTSKEQGAEMRKKNLTKAA
jgi:hypothetical protein